MRVILSTTAILLSSTVLSSDLPDLVCQEVVTETILPETWGLMGDRKVKSLYKFSDNKLYLSSSIREEYLYNDVEKIELGRYQSGYKVIVFKGVKYEKATVTHHDKYAIEISRLQCTKI
jgi:hypothetical protein